MKYLIIALLFAQCKSTPKDTTVTPTIYPQSVGYLNDFAHVLSPAQANSLDSTLRDFEKRTTNEIAVVTIDSLPSDTSTIESYSLQLANKWGVGKKGKDNGLLFLFVIKQRKMRMEVGAGLEELFTDVKCRTVMDEYIKPEFKKGNYYEGIRQGLEATMEIFKLSVTQ